MCVASQIPIASTSHALENVSNEILRASKAGAPPFVCGGGRLCGDNFVERFALFLQSPAEQRQVPLIETVPLIIESRVGPSEIENEISKVKGVSTPATAAHLA